MKFLIFTISLVTTSISFAESFTFRCATATIGKSSSVTLTINAFVDGLGAPRRFQSILNDVDQTKNKFTVTANSAIFNQHYGSYDFWLGSVEVNDNIMWQYEASTPFRSRYGHPYYGVFPWELGQKIEIKLTKYILKKDQFNRYVGVDAPYSWLNCLVE